MSDPTAYYVTVIASPGDVRGVTYIVESWLSNYTDRPEHRKVIEDAWREQYADQRCDHFVYPHHPVYTPPFGTRTADVTATRKREEKACVDEAREAVAQRRIT